MAWGKHMKESSLPPGLISDELQSKIPPRRTRHLAETMAAEKEELEADKLPVIYDAGMQQVTPHRTRQLEWEESRFTRPRPSQGRRKVIDETPPRPLQRHSTWLTRISISLIVTVVIFAILIAVGILQRPGMPELILAPGGKMYSVQVGGTAANTWDGNGPMPAKMPIAQTGPYSVLGQPTISADFINHVLSAYNSPAAGKGQALYDLGKQYGIDPAFALAFFQHESTFGTQGEARTTHSLGNLRCIPDHPCVDQDRGGYAQMSSWEDGFKTWYALIRNYYVGQRGFDTIDKIIPTYAPNADNNNEQGYIKALKHSIDTWHAGILQP
jgi:hypothetical protein